MEHRFTNEMNPSRAAYVIDLLNRERLLIDTEKDYPQHPAWLSKIEPELVENKKRAMMMYDGRTPMGVIVYQRDKDDAERLEIKNVSIDPRARGHLIGSYLLAQVEREAAENDFPGIIKYGVDAKAANTEFGKFIISRGYQKVAETDLYGSGVLDAVYEKKVG